MIDLPEFSRTLPDPDSLAPKGLPQEEIVRSPLSE
jgi:hypothetical protein